MRARRRGDHPRGRVRPRLASRSSTARRALAIDVVKQQGANTVAVAAGSPGGRGRADRRRRCPRTSASTSSTTTPSRWRRATHSVQTMLVEGAAPRRRHRLPVPELLALDAHHRAHAADLGDRHDDGDLRAGLHAQHHDAAGAVARRRPPDRRRHRGAREHRAAPPHGQVAPAGGARGDQRDRPRGARHHALHRRGVPAGGLHGGHHRAVLPPVRRHRLGRGADLAVRGLHARPDAVVGLVRPVGRPAGPQGADLAAREPLRPGLRGAWRAATAGSCALALRHRYHDARRRGRGLRRQRSSSCRMVGTEFSPAVDDGRVSVDDPTPAGSSLEAMAAKIRQADAILRTIPEVRRTYATVNSGGGGPGGGGGVTSARLRVELVPPTSATARRRRWRAPIREALAGDRRASRSAVGVGGRPRRLGRAGLGHAVGRQSSTCWTGCRGSSRPRIARIDGVTDDPTSLEDAEPTLAVRLDRDAADDLGVSLSRRGRRARPRCSAGRRSATGPRPTAPNYALNVQLPRGGAQRRGGARRAAHRRRRRALIRLDQVAEPRALDRPRPASRARTSPGT